MIKFVDTLEEADICDNLLNQLIIDEKKYDNSLKNFTVNDYFRNVIKNHDNILLVDYEDNNVVAYLFIKKINDESLKYNGYLFDGLFVLENYRNKSIASNLINEGISICRNRNAKYIDINVMYKNELAKKLYKKLDFEEFKLTFRKEI